MKTDIPIYLLIVVAIIVWKYWGSRIQMHAWCHEFDSYMNKKLKEYLPQIKKEDESTEEK